MGTPKAAGAAYRPQLDGIRAIAVGLVVTFHLGISWLPGGFTGVDVFFVLSGYLITGLLLAEAFVTGQVRLTRFYARRARRLLPAAVTVVLFVVVVGKYVSSPVEYPHLRRHATSAVMYVANWDAATLDTSYFSTDTQPNPLLHFWSLAVEEQFYFVWPLVVVGCLWLARRERRRLEPVLATVCGVVTVSGLVAALVLTPSGAAYYGTHTRAFELAAGGLLAVVMHRRGVGGPDPARSRTPMLATMLTCVGALAMLALASTINGDANYPGWSAVCVTVAAVALIAGAELASATSWTVRSLGHPVVTWVGRLSYSIYLWHWPLIVFFADDLPRPLLVAAILAAAQASYTLIEQPLRRRAFPRLPYPTVVATGVTTSAVLGLFVVPGYLHNTPDEEALIRELVHQDVAVHCLHGVNYDATHLSCILHIGSGPTVALVGDSHANMWIPALTELAERHDWTLIKTTHPGCPANDLHQAIHERETECATWRRDAYPELTGKFDPDYVILATRSYQVLLDGGSDELAAGTPAHLAAWGRAWDRTIAYFSHAGAHVDVMQVEPTLPQGILACLADHPGEASACDFPLSSDPEFSTYAEKMRAVVRDYRGVSLLDPTPLICPDRLCPALDDGVKVHIDDNHLGEDFVATHQADLAGLLAGTGLR